MKVRITSDEDMKNFGAACGALLRGGEVLELIGDVGAGKTTFTKGLAHGLEIEEAIQSPTFTINRTYAAPGGLTLSHYDFYRLNEAGIMRDELQEVLDDPKTVTVIEWSEIVAGVLPDDRVVLRFSSPGETTRTIELTAGGTTSRRVLESLA